MAEGAPESQAPDLVVDVDAHYYENPRGFAQYLEEPWRRTIASWSATFYTPISDTNYMDAQAGGRIHRRFPGGHPENRQQVIEAMRYVGTDVSVLLPSSLLRVSAVKERSVAIALCNGFIDHMLDKVVAPEDGLYTLLVLPDKCPREAVELIDRVGEAEAICGAVVGPYGLPLPLGDPFYDPIYDACSRHDLPLVLHSFNQGPWEFQMQNFTEEQLGFVLNAQIQLGSIILQGVPERFPRLRLVFEEAGIFWIPQMMYRLDLGYSMMRSKFPWLRRAPSEYVKDCFFTTQPLEPAPAEHLRAVMNMIEGSRCLLYSSDWPHRDFDAPVVIRRLAFLSREEQGAILGGNALRALRFRGLERLKRSAAATAAGAAGD